MTVFAYQFIPITYMCSHTFGSRTETLCSHIVSLAPRSSARASCSPQKPFRPSRPAAPQRQPWCGAAQCHNSRQCTSRQYQRLPWWTCACPSGWLLWVRELWETLAGNGIWNWEPPTINICLLSVMSIFLPIFCSCIWCVEPKRLSHQISWLVQELRLSETMFHEFQCLEGCSQVKSAVCAHHSGSCLCHSHCTICCWDISPISLRSDGHCSCNWEIKLHTHFNRPLSLLNIIKELRDGNPIENFFDMIWNL